MHPDGVSRSRINGISTSDVQYLEDGAKGKSYRDPLNKGLQYVETAERSGTHGPAVPVGRVAQGC